MLIELIILGGLGYIAHKTRPSPSSFSKYYENLVGHPTNKLVNLVDRLLGGGSRVNFRTTDLLLAWLVRVEGSGQLFLGVFGVWLEISGIGRGQIFEAVETGGAGGIAENIEMVDTSMAAQSEAHTLKAAGKYVEASRAYEKASQSASKVDPFAAAELLDEGARCKKMAGDIVGYESTTIKAAELFRKKNRYLRAASLYEKLAKHCLLEAEKGSSKGSSKGQVESLLKKAMNYFRKSMEYYEQEDDGRSKSLHVEVLNIMAKLGEHKKAADGFVEEAKRIFLMDSILVNQSQRMLLFAVMCLTAEDHIVANRRITELFNSYSWFANSREGKWSMLLGGTLQESHELDFGIDERIKVLDRELNMMATMPGWFTDLWNETRQSLITAEPDLT
jgi:tetratricopeptide (TPR) repeat protein